jgi:hypothetical protein
VLTFTQYIVRAIKNHPSEYFYYGCWDAGDYLANKGFQKELEKSKLFPTIGKASAFLKKSADVSAGNFTDEQYKEYFEIIPAVITIDR